MTVHIFKCDICKREIRLDKNPYVSRYSFEFSSSYSLMAGSKRGAQDVCETCVGAIQQAVCDAIDDRKKVSA